MKNNIRILITTILIIAITSCSSPENTEAQINNVDVSSASELLNNDKNIVVLDVRTPEEHAAGHIEGSVNINIAEDSFSYKAAKLDQDKTYIVHCAANTKNGRTDKSITIMKELGFKNLLNLEGGIVAWEKADQPMTKVDEIKDHQENAE